MFSLGSWIYEIHKARPRRPCFDHHPQDFALQQKPWSQHLGMPHRQSTPYDWFPSIYNLWARTSQRRALSKRINSPPPNRCIFNRDQSTQNKIQCRTHSPFTSPFWVWTKPEASIPRISVQSTICLDGYYFNSFMVATPITSISSAHPTDTKIVGLESSLHFPIRIAR